MNTNIVTSLIIGICLLNVSNDVLHWYKILSESTNDKIFSGCLLLSCT